MMRKGFQYKKMIRRVFAFALASAVLLFPAQTAYAAAGAGAAEVKRLDVSYHGQANRFVFTPGTETNPDNLFDMLEGLMPGDTRSQELTVRNEAASGARVNLYLCAYVPKLGDGATEEEKEADAKIRAFLKRLTFTVTSTRTAAPVGVNPDGRPQKLTDWAYLGSFPYNTASDLKVEVSVPAVLAGEDKYGDTYEDNDFQNLSAKIHWAFYVEEFNDTTPGGGGGGDTPDPTPNPPGNPVPPVPPTGPAPVPGGGGGAAPGGGPAGGTPEAVEAGTPGAEPQELEDLPTPLSPPSEEELGLPEEEVPLAAPGASAWALLNLLLTLLTALLCILLLVFGLKKRREDDGEDEKAAAGTDTAKAADGESEEENGSRKMALRLFSIVPAAAAVIVFVLTEDMTAPMRFVDRYTWLMALIALVQVVVCVLARKKKEEEEDAEAGGAEA